MVSGCESPCKGVLWNWGSPIVGGRGMMALEREMMSSGFTNNFGACHECSVRLNAEQSYSTHTQSELLMTSTTIFPFQVSSYYPFDFAVGACCSPTFDNGFWTTPSTLGLVLLGVSCITIRFADLPSPHHNMHIPESWLVSQHDPAQSTLPWTSYRFLVLEPCRDPSESNTRVNANNKSFVTLYYSIDFPSIHAGIRSIIAG